MERKFGGLVVDVRAIKRARVSNRGGRVHSLCGLIPTSGLDRLDEVGRWW